MSYQQQPPHGAHQQQYGGPPPGQYGGPPQGQYGAPPPGQWGGPPPHGQYGAPPPGQYGAPPPGQYGAPPPGQYGAPPPGQHGGPPQGQHGMPPPHQTTYSPPTPPSLGYDPRQQANINTDRDTGDLRNAMKGLGTNEKKLIQVLSAIPDPVIMAAVSRNYNHRFQRDLVEDIEKETSGYFEEGLVAIIRGPLSQDVWNLNDAIKGAGTKEDVLDDVLLARSNADLLAIKAEYQRVYKRSLDADVRGDLSHKTQQLFDMVLACQRAEESTPVIPQQVEHDVAELHRATEGVKLGADQITVCQVFSSRSDGQLRAIAQAYNQRYHRSLASVVEKEFSGHMRHALLRMLSAAEDRAKADADALEDAMKGAGTKDRLLVNRIVRLHWNKQHLHQVKAAYEHFYKRDLTVRVKGEISGDYERLMLALLAH